MSRPTDHVFLAIAREASASLQQRPATRRAPTVTPSSRALFAVFAVATALVATVGGAVAVGAQLPKCEPIHYVVNLGSAPPEALASVAEASARVSAESGVSFVYDGVSSAEPTMAYRGAEVLVAWVDGADLLRWSIDRDVVGVTRARQYIYLDADARLPLSFTDRYSWGGVLLHEAGHLIGLAHSFDSAEMMYPNVVAGPAQWGVGDRTALRHAGAAAGCTPNTPFR